MTHVESVEPRHLFAAAVLDTTFGSVGVVSLPSGVTVNGILATHGAIFVDVYSHAHTPVRQIYKYNDAGMLDRSWGTGGVVATSVTDPITPYGNTFDPLTMAYDARTRGLIVGHASGTVIGLQRFTADGVPDAGWGNRGFLEYHERDAGLSLDRITPLAGKQLLVIFSSVHTRDTPAAKPTVSKTAVAITLLRLDRHGRYDPTFAGDGTAVVVTGQSVARTTYAADTSYDGRTIDSDSDRLSFGDLQLRSDGGYRVIDTRTHLIEHYYTDDVPDGGSDLSESGSSVVSVDSTVISADGVVHTKQTQTNVLHRAHFTDVGLGFVGYDPVLTVAEGDGVEVVARANYVGTSVLHVGPGYRSASTPLPGAAVDSYIFDIYRGPNGDTFWQDSGVATGGTYALDPDLTLDTGFAHHGSYTGDDFVKHAVDDGGRIVVCFSSLKLERLV